MRFKFKCVAASEGPVAITQGSPGSFIGSAAYGGRSTKLVACHEKNNVCDGLNGPAASLVAGSRLAATSAEVTSR